MLSARLCFLHANFYSLGRSVFLTLDFIVSILLVLIDQSAETIITEEVNSKCKTCSSTAEDANWKGKSGVVSGHPWLVDSGSIQSEVSEETLGGSEESKHISDRLSIGLSFLSFCNWSHRHLFKVYN